QAIAPAIGQLLLELIREDAVGMIPNDRDIGQLLDRQGKGLSTAEDGVAGQENDRPGELRVTLRLEMPGLQRCEVIIARANLRLPVERDAPAVAESVDDRYGGTVVAAGAVADVDDEALQVREIMGNIVQGGSQFPLGDAFQFENAHVTE